MQKGPLRLSLSKPLRDIVPMDFFFIPRQLNSP